MKISKKGHPLVERAAPKNERPGDGVVLAVTVPRLDDLHQLQAWADACLHLQSLGLTPLPPRHVVSALRTRGWW